MSEQADAFSPEDQQLLELMSEQTGAAIYFATRFNSSSLAYQATHDFLTGLANRSSFMENLRGAFAEAEKKQTQFAVLIIDMDDLKQANDAEGHLFGDELLIELANRIRNATQATDLVARLGGDEFGVIAKEMQGSGALTSLIAGLNASIASEFKSSKQLYRLKASIGGACYPSDGETIELLLDTADRRMYEVKNAK
jgi:diguanylate cyclase